ncbi:carotenoid 1,2-hydratase [Geomonas sp. Red32]|uniref:lipocalin-like domain-containing protein n=1 Tax=Geomonas sp. Red32 TaxID=2912856 RepID=UPI00202CBE40|nr:lipocalin-like domain-containing protein [Geomonas sp. Red32]MCM0083105.1 carotenoid 1,2-hydratase [Geomonas sp. Red32]
MRRILLLSLLVVALLLSLFEVRRQGRGARPEAPAALSVAKVLGGAPAAGFSRALTPRTFSFPADHGPHHGFRNEWWYFTGNLQSADGHRFGYQLTFFRVALAPGKVERASHWAANEVYMAHFAVTDVGGQRFRFAERFSREALGLAGAGGQPLTVWLENWSARETASSPWSMKLTAAGKGMAIDLDLTSLTAPILNGEHGLSRKSATPGNASYYYSIPRMKSTGTLRSGNRSYQVSGLSWLDREWSTSALEAGQAGWDWLALQLADGRDLMFYRMRRRDGSADPSSSGTLVTRGGGVLHLTREQVRMEVLQWWTSPHGSRYPARWRVTVPSQGIDLEVVPRLADQELATSFRYWEGAVESRGAGGSPSGSGYLEMTGY